MGHLETIIKYFLALGYEILEMALVSFSCGFCCILCKRIP